MKKISIDSERLKKSLKKLGQAISSSASHGALLSQILVRVEKDHLLLATTDTEITIIERIAMESELQTSFLLPFQQLAKIISFQHHIPVHLEPNKKSVRVTGNGDTYLINTTLAPEQFPALPELNEENTVAFDHRFVSEMKQALLTVSKSEDKPQLTKVLLEIREHNYLLASTDGSYLVFSRSTEKDFEHKTDILLHARAIKAVDDADSLDVSWSENFHRLRYVKDGVTTDVIVTKPSYKYVNFRGIYPNDFDTNLVCKRQDLLSALERCGISTEQLKMTKLDLSGKDTIKMMAKDSIQGIDINITIPGNYTGSVESVAFNSDRFLKMMQQVEYDEIGLAIHDESKGIVLRSEEDPGYLSLLMPMVKTS